MPATQLIQLIDSLIDAFERSGGSGVLVSSARAHPRKFVVTDSFGGMKVWVYAWTLTPGGRPQLKNEYRIQMTSVTSPLEVNPDGATVLMGYEPNLKMFAGFDLAKHRTFTTGSPSVQVDVTCLHRALQDGLAFHRKGNDEIVVGVRPDQLLNYVHTSTGLHRYGSNRDTFEIISKASSLKKIRPNEMALLTGPRQRIVQTISRIARSANFREQVLNAYGQRCAVTRLELRLVEAAHILPVSAPQSIDHVVNGISLSPTYHRAFDTGLIYLDDSYVMKLNSKKEQFLSALKLDGGMGDFKSKLGKIHLPPDQQQWPDIDIIRKANKYRGID